MRAAVACVRAGPRLPICPQPSGITKAGTALAAAGAWHRHAASCAAASLRQRARSPVVRPDPTSRRRSRLRSRPTCAALRPCRRPWPRAPSRRATRCAPCRWRWRATSSPARSTRRGWRRRSTQGMSCSRRSSTACRPTTGTPCSSRSRRWPTPCARWSTTRRRWQRSAKPSSPRAKAWICRPFASSRAWPATWRVLVTQRLHQQAVIAYVDARAARLADTARLFAALGGAAPEADAGVAAEEGAGPP